MAREVRRQITDVRAMRALAHPIRYRLFGHLMAVGAQTASQCADVVGASPSNCSYHLRELARYGLVERVGPDSAADATGHAAAADGRDRPWRPTATGFRSGRPDGDRASPGDAAVSRRLIHAGIDDDAALAHVAVDAHDGQPPAWRAAETIATFGLTVTPAELVALTTAVDAILRPFIGLTREEAPRDARPVHVVVEAFLRPMTPAGTGHG
jgi:DNA-binding Lrp family transcriptional regulator